MTVEEVRQRVGALEEQYDDEAAHSEEDKLRHEVLQAIADGASNAAELATEVLKTSAIEFCRWCA